MPDAAWAVNGYPPGSSQGRDAALLPRSSHCVSTRHRQRTLVHRSSSRPAPDAAEPRRLPRRSAQRSSANAPVGGLKPPPQATPEGQPTSIASTAPHSAGPRSTNPSCLLRSRSQHLFYSTAFSGTTINQPLHVMRSCAQLPHAGCPALSSIEDQVDCLARPNCPGAVVLQPSSVTHPTSPAGKTARRGPLSALRRQTPS